jgi:uncharacterized LabA/DUF88 family protein
MYQIQGGSVTGSYTGPSEIKYLFIDGGCLRACLERISEVYADNQALRIDYETLTKGYSKVFYYDALPGRRSSETETEEEYRARTSAKRSLFDQLSSLDRFHVYEGDVRRSTSRRGPEQKKIDVMIAVDMLTHSFRRNMHQATLLTGDLDFKPLLDALVQEGMFVSLWFPPGETSKELKSAADRSRPFTVYNVYEAMHNPKQFTIPNGVTEKSKGEYAEVLKDWIVEGRTARLMRDNDGFIFEMPSAYSPGTVTYFSHPKETILRAFVKEVHGWLIPAT